MAAPRYFVIGTCEAGVELALDDDDAHHVAHVLRLQAGDRVVVIDSTGPWDAELTAVSRRAVRARPIARSGETGGELPLEITVLQALTKGSKFDDVVEKCVELGAHRIVPVVCARSYAEATQARVDRWRRIARAAAQQSRRRVIPAVDAALEWSDAIRGASSPPIVAWEGAASGSLAAALSRLDATSPVSIAVGPEGSFTEDELDLARAAGCALVSLGPTILRTETAAAALIAAIASRLW